MPLHALAGKPAPPELLIDVAALERAYYETEPDLTDPAQRVAFGTSGHRGTPLSGSFNEAHIAATTQAIVEYRRGAGIDGPLLIGKDTHAISTPAERTALEVLAAAGGETWISGASEYTPTPVISRLIIEHNAKQAAAGRTGGLADGIVITPSHNPPSDGGFKYNPPHGGPADSDITGWIQSRANALLEAGWKNIARIPYEQAAAAERVKKRDFLTPYVAGLEQVIDFDVIRDAGISIGVDPMGSANVAYWGPIAQRYGLKLEVVNDQVDFTFSFMTVDRDGKIRMDCSSPYAMASLVRLKDKYDIAFGADTDSDRHGIVTPSGGLVPPNHYLAVAIDYLFQNRPQWAAFAAVGKTLVSSAMIDRVAAALGRTLFEVPVGFKYFSPGLADGSLGFGGEESAGASFLTKDGKVWTTDKDGIILGLLAAEIVAKTREDPSQHYQRLTERFGAPVYRRIDAPATLAQRTILKTLSPASVQADMLAGEPITAKLVTAPGNGEAIGGLKVTTETGWFAARPSGTEDIYKIYAESFRDEAALDAILVEAQEMVKAALGT